jgi:hypothetical protein
MEPQTRKQLIAGAVAAVLTLGSAGAAVALNLGASTDAPPSEAGRLTATSTGAAPPTVVVDVTVPDTVGGPGTVGPAGTPAPGPAQQSPPAVSGEDHGGEYDRDDRHESEDDRDHAERREDDRHEFEGRDDDD